MGIKSIALAASTLVLSTSVNAVVINTLNGVDYEWLELTVTEGLSRSDVEAQLADPNSSLFGYEYASRSLLEDLLLSYSDWDGITGSHSSASVVSGVDKFVEDFGSVFTSFAGETSTVDGGDVSYDYREYARGFYGLDNECGIDVSCHGGTSAYYDSNNIAVAANQSAGLGWSSTDANPPLWNEDDSTGRIGSFLVTTVVPVPSAVWLFGSGLLGLIGLARRKA